MDISAVLVGGAAFVVGALVAWVAAQWWFGRKLRSAAALNERTDKARQFTASQASLARKQIEVLQQDIALLRMAVVKRGSRPEPSSASSIQPDEAPPAGRPALPADGFADTLVLPAARR